MSLSYDDESISGSDISEGEKKDKSPLLKHKNTKKEKINTNFWELIFRWMGATKSLNLEIFDKSLKKFHLEAYASKEGVHKPMRDEDILIESLFEYICKTFPKVRDLEDKDELSLLPLYTRHQQETVIC